MPDKGVKQSDSKKAPELHAGRTTHRSKPKRFFRKLIRYSVFFLIAFVVLFIIAFLFVQTESFNTWLLEYSSGKLNNSWKLKESTIHADALRGNIFTGLRLYHGSIAVKEDTLIKFNNLYISYDIFGLLKKEIKIKRIILNEPEINLTNVKDETGMTMWNLQYLLKSEKKPDTVKSVFDWGVTVEELKINNGSVRLLAEKPQNLLIRDIKMKHVNSFDANYFDINNLQVDLDAKYYPGLKELNLKNLSFNTNSDFNVKKCSLEAEVDEKDSTAVVKDLDITTSRTQLNSKMLSMDRIDPLGDVVLENLKDSDVKINLDAQKINSNDIVFFLPGLDFVNGAVRMEIKAQGKLGRLTVDKLTIQTPGSLMNLKGRVDNLQDPSAIYLDLAGDDLVLDPSDIRTILPGMQIPDYNYIGKIYANIRFAGEPRNFKTDFDVRSSAGNANGSIAMNLNNAPYHYEGQVETSGLDIGAVIKNEELKSSINTRAEITGSGFSLKDISTKINYELTNSKIYNQDIIKSAGTVEIHNQNVNADISYLSKRIQSSIKGRINLDNLSDAEYTMKGTVRDLDVSEYTKDQSDKSNLNFSFDINGKGAGLENIEGSYKLNFNHSYFSSYNIPASTVEIKINNSKSNGYLKVFSDFFDFRAKGSFNLQDIAEVLNSNIQAVTQDINSKLAGDTVPTASLHSAVNNTANFDVEYEFIAKNMLLLTKMFDTTGFNLIGDIRGSMSNSEKGFNTNADFSINDFTYTDGSKSVKKLTGNLKYENDYTIPFNDKVKLLYPVRSKINAVSEGVKIGGNSFDTVNAGISLNNGLSNFNFYGKQDTTLLLKFEGNSNYDRDNILMEFDTLEIGYRNNVLHNKDKLNVAFNPASYERTLTFQKFDLGNSMMELNLKGDLSFAGESDLDIEAKDIKIGRTMELIYPDYASYTNQELTQFRSPVRGNIRRLSILYKGNRLNPVISLEMNTDMIRYERSRVGRIDAFMDYSKSVLSSDVLVSNAEGSGKLRLTGDIPVADPFGSKDTSSYGSVSGNPVDFKLTARNFQINFFSRLIPRIGDIRGLMNGEITTKGTVEKPELAGDMEITNGRFFLGVTGLFYRYNAKMRTNGSNLIVDDFRILNVGDDRRHIDFWGNVNFEGLRLNDIDLTSSGDLAVLDQSASNNDLGLYGDMVAGIGTPAITLKGDYKKLSLTGQLLIKSANVKVSTFPGSAYNISSDNFVYKVMKDTTGKSFKDTVIQISPDKINEVDPFLRTNVVTASSTASPQFNMNYDLNVKTVKNATVSIMFNDITKEELFGQISADLDVNNKATGNLQIFGNVDVVGDSYYRFYRNFKVKDSRLSFTGSPSNPELNIHASYQNKQTVEGISSSTNSNVIEIVLEILGTAKKPQLTLKLYEGGVEVTGSDAQADAISYLLFGVSKNELISGQKGTLAKNVGATTSSAYLSSLFGNALRDIAPFIVNTEVNYSEGSVATGTDIRITSEFGDATVRFGGKILSGIGNAEVTIEYPLNKLLNINVSNNLILEASRVIDESSLSGGRSVLTGARLIYKIRY